MPRCISAFLFSIAVLTAATLTLPAHAATCVHVTFLDAEGVVIPTESPVTGIMLGGQPMMEGQIPVYASIRAEDEVTCPQALLDQIATLFDQSCSTANRRQSTATQHNSSIDVVNNGCSDLSEALNNSE